VYIIRKSNHKRLNPKIWRRDCSLRPDVDFVLNNIVVAVMSSLATFSKIPVDLEKDIEEIVIGGSCADYFYTKKSDIDLKIKVRPDRYLEKMDIETYKSFSKFVSSYFVAKYSPNIFGIPVDIGIVGESLDITKYSLIQKKWLIKPKKLTNSELKYIEHRKKLYYLSIRNIMMGVIKDKNKHFDIPKVYAYLRKKRVESWKESFGIRGPYSQALSRVKNSGLTDKMLNTNKELIKSLMLGDTN